MRPSIIGGVVILCLGGFLLLRGGHFTSREDVVKVGDVKVTANERHAIPTWVGGAAVGAGLVLIAAGVRKPA